MIKPKRGRRSRFAHYEELVEGLAPGSKKRPTYLDSIGVYKGDRSTTVWVKVHLRHGGLYRGRSYAPGQSVEIKLGNLSSWSWEQLEKERDRLQGRADRGEPLEDSPELLFRDQAAEWLALKEGRPGHGIASGNISAHLNPAFGSKALSAITVADVDRWQAQQLKSLKPATVQRQLSTLKAILNYAVKAGHIDRNPATRAEPIRGAEPRQRHLSRGEWEAVLEAASKLEAAQHAREKYPRHEIKGWLRDYLLWALHSGMRRGEILALRIEGVKTSPLGHKYALVTKSKSGKPRQVSCTPEMEAIVERLQGVRRDADDHRLFPVSLKTVKRWLPKVWKAAGLEDVRLHDFRRTHATQLVNAGADLYGVAYRLGHKDLSMLEKVYAVPLGDKRIADHAASIFTRKLDE